MATYETHDLISGSDYDALTEAANMATDCPAFELWSGTRQVACVVNRPHWTAIKAILDQHHLELRVPL